MTATPWVVSWNLVAELTAEDRAEAKALSQAVYPPAVVASWPGRHLEWSRPEWCARVRAPDGSLAGFVGALLREARHAGRPVRVGGIGGVMTHPDHRGRGVARAGIDRAVAFFRDGGADFGLLVCETALVPLYGRLGWQALSGELLVTCHGPTVPFTFNRVLTLPLASPDPPRGTVDLLGPPW